MNLRGETPRGVNSAIGRANGGEFVWAERLREGMWRRLEFCGMACQTFRERGDWNSAGTGKEVRLSRGRT